MATQGDYTYRSDGTRSAIEMISYGSRKANGIFDYKIKELSVKLVMIVRIQNP